MCWKAFRRNIIKSSNLNSLTLIEQDCNLVFTQNWLVFRDDISVAREHFFGYGFKHLTIVKPFFFSERLEIGLIWHIKKLKFSQYICKTFLSWLLILSLLLNFSLNSFLICLHKSISNRSIFNLSILCANSSLLCLIFYESIGCGFIFELIEFIFQIDFLYSKYKSSLCTIFNWNIVITIEEKLLLRFFRKNIWKNRTVFMWLSTYLFFCGLRRKHSFYFSLFWYILTLVLGFWFSFDTFCTFRFSKWMCQYILFTDVFFDRIFLGSSFGNEILCRFGPFKSFAIDLCLFVRWKMIVLFRSVFHFDCI